MGEKKICICIGTNVKNDYLLSEEVTAAIGKVLAEHNHRLIWFCNGDEVEKSQDEILQMNIEIERLKESHLFKNEKIRKIRKMCSKMC